MWCRLSDFTCKINRPAVWILFAHCYIQEHMNPMTREDLLSLILDSMKDSVVFVDCSHVIRYMNAPARVHYSRWGDVIGKSIFDCHNETSSAVIRDCFVRLQAGEEEVLFTDSEKHRVYMRAVRDGQGTLMGYYERYEPPRQDYLSTAFKNTGRKGSDVVRDQRDREE